MEKRIKINTKILTKEIRKKRNGEQYPVFHTEDKQEISCFEADQEQALDKVFGKSIELEIGINNTNGKEYKNVRGFPKVLGEPSTERITESAPSIVEQAKKALVEPTDKVDDFGCKLRYKQLATGKLVIEVCGCKLKDAEQTKIESDKLLEHALAKLKEVNTSLQGVAQ